MKAFEVLDQENKGYLTTEELTKYMTEEGTWSFKMELVVGTSCFHLPVLFPKDISHVCYVYACYLTDNNTLHSSIGSNTQLVTGEEGFKSCQSKPVFFQMS